MKYAWFPAWLTVLVAVLGCETPMRIEAPPLAGLRATQEDQINAVLNDVQRGLENRQLYRVLAHVSPNYRDGNGHTYDDLPPRFNALFERYRSIQIRRTRPRIFVLGDYAHAVETFGTNAEPRDTMEHSPLNIEGSVVVYFERVGNRWMITSWENP